MSTEATIVRRRPRILLGITGSVAAVKGPELALRLSRDSGMDVRILLTQGGQNFWDKSSGYNSDVWNQLNAFIEASKKRMEQGEKATDDKATVQIHDASDEWRSWNRIGDPVLHTDLRDWADVLVIAPLSAHSLAKISQGLCDDTLSCVARAWDFGNGTRPGKLLLLVPAMNTAMWQHPLTQDHLDKIQTFWNANNPLHIGSHQKQGIRIVSPQVKTLACGEVGNGAMATVEDIIACVEEAVQTFLTAPSL